MNHEFPSILAVSIWTDVDAAKQMDTLAPMLAQRPILEQAGVQFDPIANYQALWTIHQSEQETSASGSILPWSASYWSSTEQR